MQIAESLQIVQSIVMLAGVAFAGYVYFKTPQDNFDKKLAVSEEEEKNKAVLIARQLQWEKESNDRRFEELNKNLAAQTALAMNHTHTIDGKIDNLAKLVDSMNVNFVRELAILSTEIRVRKELK